ncbi:hypothetical protein THRCLA_03514 [Thraustotheca clavata]|uniref:ELMO domain-containing protein n=1 Tax=Thraustotheca clavata TaxID=74557 RepID=A0A1W0A1T9_9STRA|nr:hypothetical protein THRCLA_03514 [Thraustotheca clavata]
MAQSGQGLHVDTTSDEGVATCNRSPVSPAFGMAQDQVDASVLAELPKEIQDEVLASFSVPILVPPPPQEALDNDTTQETTWTCPMCTFSNHAAMAKSVVKKSITAIKTTHEHREELLQSATAKIHQVHETASKQLHHVYETTTQQLQAALSPRSPGRFPKKGKLTIPEPNVLLELNVLRTDLKTPCKPGDEVYEALLLELWSSVYLQNAILSMPSNPFVRDGEGWLSLGFQRSNPDTDFRGGGLLGLKCLVYVCSMHMDKMSFIFQEQVPQSGHRWYPVCVAGINLTCMLAGLLKLGDGSYEETEENYWRLFEEPSAFYELYFYAFLKMDQIWHRSQATYMQFGDVLKATKRLVRYALAQGPTNLTEFAAFTEKVHVDDFKITKRTEYYQDYEDGECPDPRRVTEDDFAYENSTDDIASLHYDLKK